MKTIPLDLIRVLVIQQIDKLYYREGTNVLRTVLVGGHSRGF